MSGPESESLAEIARALRVWIDVERSFGCDPPVSAVWARAVAPARPSPAARSAPSARIPARAPAPEPSAPSAPAPAVDDAERARREELLAPIRAEVAACERCRLAGGRTRTVFGVGDPSARLMFVGEGPGYDEDRAGEPFVGKAGQLLDKIIAAMGLRRADVYIANIVKCRPPNNRNPDADEVASCLPYLHRQIEIVRPEVICCLGAVAARSLLGRTDSVGRMRGATLEFGGIPVRVTYHPAYLLRNPADKAKTWTDIQQVMALLGLERRG